MFSTGSEKYQTDIKLGEKYRETEHGLVGTVTSVHFYQHGCERATLELISKDGELKEYTFDAPRLEHCETKKIARTNRTGGPRARDDRDPRGLSRTSDDARSI